VGLGLIVVENYEEPDVKLDYFGGTSGTYAGFDRFDRIVDQRWYDYGASADRDRYKYGYDRASDRTYRENHVSKNLGTPVYLDEYYTYDGLYRLKNFDRGQLNGTYTGIQGTPSKEEDFTLDPLGNWSGYVQKSSGTTDLNQSRSVNKVNEISGISETTGPSWIDPAYDRNGNMTTIPKPANLTQGLTGKYDAWNRLVEVKDGTTVISTSEYDGLNRRIKHGIDSQAPDSPNGLDKWEHLFYNTSWQLLETRETTTESDQPENLQPKYQYLWSPRYIDACILRDKNTDTDGLCDDERAYFLGDANFNYVTLADTGGDALERCLYSPYGVPTFHNASWTSPSSSSAYAVALAFTGARFDAEHRMHELRSRGLNPCLGAFLRRDPKGYVGSLNVYEYARGRVTVWLDPKGTDGNLVTPGKEPWHHGQGTDALPGLLGSVKGWLKEILPGLVCIDESCKHGFVVPREQDSVWIRCNPGECCRADGVFYVGEGVTANEHGVNTCGRTRRFACTTRFFKVVNGCMATVKCDREGLPYIDVVRCLPYVCWVQHKSGGCVAGFGRHHSGISDDRENQIPAGFDPTTGPLPPKPTITWRPIRPPPGPPPGYRPIGQTTPYLSLPPPPPHQPFGEPVR
jgi:RHS repeat-associated protein